MHILKDNLITTLNSLVELEDKISDKLCLLISKEASCMRAHCANCVLLNNWYTSSEDYPLQVIKTHQSLKGSSNEP